MQNSVEIDGIRFELKQGSRDEIGEHSLVSKYDETPIILEGGLLERTIMTLDAPSGLIKKVGMQRAYSIVDRACFLLCK